MLSRPIEYDPITGTCPGDAQVDAAKLTEADIWYAWVTLPQIGPDGQSCFQRPELDQARDLQYKVAMTEWNWNGWWGPAIRDQVALDSLFARGLGAAGILHAIMRQGDVMELATQSMLIGDGWKIHAIWRDRTGKIPPFMLPSGHRLAKIHPRQTFGRFRSGWVLPCELVHDCSKGLSQNGDWHSI